MEAQPHRVAGSVISLGYFRNPGSLSSMSEMSYHGICGLVYLQKHQCHFAITKWLAVMMSACGPHASRPTDAPSLTIQNRHTSSHFTPAAGRAVWQDVSLMQQCI